MRKKLNVKIYFLADAFNLKTGSYQGNHTSLSNKGV